MTARPQLPDRAPRKKGAPTALDGLLVVDFTRVVAGPACTQTLADFGAEVIKIENPEGGDDTRHYEHAEIGGESAAYLSLNRNKRGIALDFTKPAALRGGARADREGGCGGREFLRRGDEEVWPRLCLGRLHQSAAGLLLDLGLRPQGAFRAASGIRSDHAGRKRLHVAERLSGRTAGAHRSADRRHGDGNVGLQRHPARIAGARPARPRPACRGCADRHRGRDDRLLRHGLSDHRRRIRAASAIHRTARPASAFTRPPTDRSISPAPTTGCIAASSPRCWSGPTSSPIRNSRRGKREPPTGKSCAPSSARFSGPTGSRTGWRR